MAFFNFISERLVAPEPEDDPLWGGDPADFDWYDPDEPTIPLILTEPPSAEPAVCQCGCPIFWEGGYRQLLCCECSPPEVDSTVIQFWRVEPHGDSGTRWQIHNFIARHSLACLVAQDEGDQWT